MSTRVHASRSHHNLRSEPSSSRVAHPSHAGEPHKYGHRQPGGGHRQQVSEPARSLRTVASSSRLPRQVYRDDMPPPPVPSPRKRLPPAPAPDRMHPARSHMESHEHHQRLPSIPYQPPPASRLETYDRVPSHRPPRSAREPGAAPRLELSRNDDHEVVLSRMRQNGWQGVGGKRHGSDDAMSQRSLSSSSLTPSERDNQPHASSAGLAKVDSGYADEIDGVEDKTAGEKVLEGWSALKKAVAGLASEGSASHGQGAQMWNRLTTTLAASVGTAQDAWNAEDDGSVGPDGETKLGRAIKSYHLSRVESAEDVPEWILNDAERAQYHRRKLSHARSTQDFERPRAHAAADRPLARQYHSEERLPSHGARGGGGGGGETAVIAGGVGRGSAADRLARMREERRMRANAT